MLIWDAFTGQNTDVVKKRLSDLGILTVNVANKLTHLLQPLNLTTNATFKNIERREFSNYFTSTILNELTKDPTLDLTTNATFKNIERREFSNYFTSTILNELTKDPTLDLTTISSTLKPIYFETLKQICKFFETEEGKNIGFRAAGIIQAVEGRLGENVTLDPYL